MIKKSKLSKDLHKLFSIKEIRKRKRSFRYLADKIFENEMTRIIDKYMTQKELAQMRLDIDTAAFKLETILKWRTKLTGDIRHKLTEALKLLAKWSLDDEKPSVDD